MLTLNLRANSVSYTASDIADIKNSTQIIVDFIHQHLEPKSDAALTLVGFFVQLQTLLSENYDLKGDGTQQPLALAVSVPFTELLKVEIVLGEIEDYVLGSPHITSTTARYVCGETRDIRQLLHFPIRISRHDKFALR